MWIQVRISSHIVRAPLSFRQNVFWMWRRRFSLHLTAGVRRSKDALSMSYSTNKTRNSLSAVVLCQSTRFRLWNATHLHNCQPASGRTLLLLGQTQKIFIPNLLHFYTCKCIRHVEIHIKSDLTCIAKSKYMNGFHLSSLYYKIFYGNLWLFWIQCNANNCMFIS